MYYTLYTLYNFVHYQIGSPLHVTYLSACKMIFSTMRICHCKRASRTSYMHANCAPSRAMHIYADTHGITFSCG